MHTVSPTANVEPARWNFRQLGAALFISFVLQNIFLPCLCPIGTAKVVFALSFDGLVLVRMIWAYFRRETGKGWIVYAVLCYSSVVWIEGITYIVLGDT